jgi:hypothetical protein
LITKLSKRAKYTIKKGSVRGEIKSRIRVSVFAKESFFVNSISKPIAKKGW